MTLRTRAAIAFLGGVQESDADADYIHDIRTISAAIEAEAAQQERERLLGHDCLMPSACGVTGFYCSNAAPPPAPSGLPEYEPLTDLPPRIAVDDKGNYWRDYLDHYSMPPVSDDNEAVEPVAYYVRLQGKPVPAGTDSGLRDLLIENTDALVSWLREKGEEAQAQRVIAELDAALAAPATEPELGSAGARPSAAGHEPDEPHRYRIECEICGQFGTINLSVEPQRAAYAAAAQSPEAVEP